MNDPVACLRLARTQGVGPTVYRRLLARFGSAEEALRVLPDLARKAGRETPPPIPSAGTVAREMKQVAAQGGRILFLGSPEYPFRLAQLDDAPAALTVLGDLAALTIPSIAIVGSRNASANGMEFASELGASFARAGFVVTSGLARGIDAAAHRGALTEGRSIAAIAGGIDKPYPPENATLQDSIAASGCVVAEAPLGTAPIARHFPRRNRIIAGLSLGVVVVEAALQSGSLITARLANEQGREVFAVPGNPRDPRSAGCNRLLREGAIMAESASDVLEHLAQHRPITESFTLAPGLAEPRIAMVFVADATVSGRSALIQLLGPVPTLVDDLVRHCQLSPTEVHAALMDLELAGRVERLPGNRVALLDRAA
jgi:DNA processing protein